MFFIKKFRNMKAYSAPIEKNCGNAVNDQREPVHISTALCIFKEDQFSNHHGVRSFLREHSFLDTSPALPLIYMALIELKRF